MKSYEGFLVFAPEPTEDGRKKQVEEVDGLIAKFGGKITQKDDLGKKALGYFRKKQREGYCFVYNVDLDPAKVLELRKSLELQANLIHYLWTVKNITVEKKPRKKASAKPAGVKKEEAPAKKTTAGAK